VQINTNNLNKTWYSLVFLQSLFSLDGK
jgi:hypothetical protein